MRIAALVLWVLTAGGGFVLLSRWIAGGGARRSGPGGPASRFPVPLVFGHFLLAAAGLVLWITYVATTNDGIGWTAFVLLAVVALLGFAMFARWIPTYRAGRLPTDAAPAPRHSDPVRSPTAASRTTTRMPEHVDAPAERHFPVPIVIGHGLLAATTLVLVLLTLLGS